MELYVYIYIYVCKQAYICIPSPTNMDPAK